MSVGAIPQRVLALQRSAGNRAVAKNLRRTPRTLARYESAEHVDMGDRYPAELSTWIGTPDGQAWVAKYGLKGDVKGLDSDWYALGRRKIGAGPIVLSPGEITAMAGDFYESWRRQVSHVAISPQSG